MLKKLHLFAASLIIVSSIFVVPTKTLAFNSPTNAVGNSKKLWKIQFTKEITMDDITKQGITIKDSNNNAVDVTFDLGQDQKSLLINPPIGGYIPSEKYTVNISQNVHSGNLKLPKDIGIQFNTSNDAIPIPTKVNRQAVYGDIVGISGNFQGFKYEHYGIYIGDNKVIQYSSTDKTITNAEISIGDMDTSFPTGKYFVLDFGNNAKYSSDDTVKRAQSRLGEKNYNLLTNNCEHFAVWCKTNNAESYQIDSLDKTQIQTLKQLLSTGIIPD
jgi:hypothetical protein